MSEYGFGYNDPEFTPAPEETQSAQGPKWFREGLDKLSGQVRELQAENERLKNAQKRAEVAETLKTKGFAPQAAGLYTGDPAGLDDWLTANAAALARLPQTEGEQPSQEELGAPQGTPPSIVTPEGQAEIARMQAMGAGNAAAPGGEQETVSKIQAMDDEAQFAQFMRAQGNPYF
jgi:hypothetical protein